jgi:hypothetical protein
MAITRFISERDDFPRPTASERTRKDAALDESGADGLAQEIHSAAAGLQELLDDRRDEWTVAEAAALRDAIEVLGKCHAARGGNEVLSHESLRAKNTADQLLEGRRTGRRPKGYKNLKDWAESLKG